MAVSRKGLLIDYEFCTGCYSCVLACKQHLGLPAGQWGIRVLEVGPELAQGKPMFYYLPFPTDLCDLCETRIAEGIPPACVKHCTAGIIKVGAYDQLAKEAQRKPRTVIWFPR